jgi:glycosyltransferase involved in cell wall biosynthesis
MRARETPRVALVFGTFPPERNGGADFVANFARALADAGCDVHVVTSPAAGAAAREQPSSRVTVHRVVSDWTLVRGGRHDLRRVDELLATERVEVVHVFFPDSVVQERYRLPAALALGRLPLVTTFWNLGLGRRSPLATKLEALALLMRSAVLTSHDPGYLRPLRLVAGRSRPVHWLPVGTNLAPRAGVDRGEIRRRLGLDGEAVLGYFGHLDFTRGVEDLFEALGTLRRDRDARLVMVGAAGEREPLYRRLAQDLGVAEALRWTGYLPAPEAADVLAAVDLCVLPYRRTSLGRSALAAALHLGVPTVLGGTPAGIAPLRPGDHVALTPPGDSAALASTLAALIGDEEARDRLSAGARSASRLFAWPRIASGALALYRAALRRRKTA